MYAPHPVSAVSTALCEDYIVPCISPSPILPSSVVPCRSDSGRSMSTRVTAADGKPRCHPSRNEKATPGGQGCRPVSPVQPSYPVRNACSPVCLKERMNSGGNIAPTGRVTGSKSARSGHRNKLQKFFDSIKKIFTRSKSAKRASKTESNENAEKCNKVFPELNGAREGKAPDKVDFLITAYNVKRNDVTNELQVESNGTSEVIKLSAWDNAVVTNYKAHLGISDTDSSTNTSQPNDQKLAAVGEYTLGEVIGTGSFSKVRLASRGEERVAIKMIKIDAVQESKKLVDSIEREISILKSLNHPNIVRYISNVRTSNQVCIITEFIDGMELFQLVVKQKKLSEQTTRTIFHSLTKVIGYMHENGIAHRDLKLENVMVRLDSENSSNYLVKLIDFGLAYRFSTVSLLSTRCGSEEYAAPEIIRGSKYCGKKSDVWSLGIILYACLCGNLPFNPDSSGSKSLFDKICRCDLKFPVHLSQNARSLLEALLTVDPAKRPDIPAVLAHSFFVNK